MSSADSVSGIRWSPDGRAGRLRCRDTRYNNGMKLAAATIGALAVTAVAPAAVQPHSGLYGTVKRGPTSPVCIAGQPCSAPARYVSISFTNRAGLTSTAKTDTAGTYRIRLRPATYKVSVSSGRISPTVVRVVRSKMVRVNFSIDTGIR